MVVDVDRERGGVDDARLGPDAARARAVDRHEDTLREVGGPLTLQAAALGVEEPVLARERRRPADEHDDVLTELLQSEPHAEQRAEGVAVGRLVRGDHVAVVLVECGHDRLHVSLVLHRTGDRAPQAPARRSAS